jgi:hypothetical protein
MNREYTPTNKLQNYVSKLTLDENRGVYLYDTETPSTFSYIVSKFLTIIIIGIGIVIVLGYVNLKFNIDIMERLWETVSSAFTNMLQYVNNVLFDGGPIYETKDNDKSYIEASGESDPDIQGDGVNETAYPMKSNENTNEQSFEIVNTAPQLERRRRKYEDKQYMNDVQYNKPIGYCFIGRQNDKRHCSGIIEAEQCVSGDIFPSMDNCINPNIRIH